MWTYKERLMAWYHQAAWMMVLGMPLMILLVFYEGAIKEGMLLISIYFSTIFIPPLFEQLYQSSGGESNGY